MQTPKSKQRNAGQDGIEFTVKLLPLCPQMMVFELLELWQAAGFRGYEVLSFTLQVCSELCFRLQIISLDYLLSTLLDAKRKPVSTSVTKRYDPKGENQS
jgi:hypothetical protein